MLTGRGPISVSLNFKDLNPSSFFLYTIKGFQVHSSRRRVMEKTDAMQNSAAGMEVDATAAPARQEPVLFAQKPNFRPLKAHEISDEFRKVPVTPLPLKKSWLEIYTPIYEEMKIDIRMNLKARRSSLRPDRTPPTSATSRSVPISCTPSCLASTWLTLWRCSGWTSFTWSLLRLKM
ncbi:UNVERIFIED_CONTAM: RNA-binding protein PNO1 [Sesamum angustifolium]|uniref:RNA-binding protein PNO1 n=1 Tax=Sesamum angustifolium TaxID=2727405 RepID=A0AAW2RQD5_9LAMI